MGYAKHHTQAAREVRLLERAVAFLADLALRTSFTSSLHPKTSAYLESVASDGECFGLPDFIRATEDGVAPIFCATCAWARPCAARPFRNSSRRAYSSLSSQHRPTCGRRTFSSPEKR